MNDTTKNVEIIKNNKRKIFINLTNGIEAIGTFDKNDDINFIRLQSSQCESKKWDRILQDLDNNLLLYLALGYRCVIYDYSHRDRMSRALYQGIQWVRYVLYRIWFKEKIDVDVRGSNCKKYFEEQYRKLDKYIINRIKYFRKFLNTDGIKFSLVYGTTNHDGDYEYFKKLLKEKLL